MQSYHHILSSQANGGTLTPHSRSATNPFFDIFNPLHAFGLILAVATVIILTGLPLQPTPAGLELNNVDAAGGCVDPGHFEEGECSEILGCCKKWIPASDPRCKNPGPGGGCCTSYGVECKDPIVQLSPPTISGSFSCDQWGKDGWCVDTLNLNLAASDPQGQSLLISGAVNGIPFACPNGNTSCSVPITAEGAGSASYDVNSATGLSASGSAGYQLDATTPQIDGALSGASGSNGWYISSVTVSASASDAASGLASFEYSLDGSAWAAYSSELTLLDGVHTVDFHAEDVAGNQNSASQSISIDTITPNLDLSMTGTSGNNSWYTSDVQVVVVASDSGSGLMSLDYSLDTAGWTSYNGPLVLTNGIHSLSIRALDVAGNLTQTDQQIKVDTLTPSISLAASGTPGNSGWYVSEISVSASGADAGSGLASFEFSLNDGAWTSYTNALPCSDGHYSLKFRAIDSAGNTTITPAQTYLIDTMPPSINLPKSSMLGKKVEYGAQDNGSGLSALRVVIEDEDERWPKVAWDEYPVGVSHTNDFLWDGKFKDGTKAPEGTYYATVKASDVAGNEGRQTASIVVENNLWTLILPPFIPPVSTPAPPSIQPSPGGNTSFGGENNIEFADSQTGNVTAGGNTNAAPESLASSAFSSGSTSKTNTTDASNILWGAAAMAAIGAFWVEMERRKEAEKAERLAMLDEHSEKHDGLSYKDRAKAYQVSLNSFVAGLIDQGYSAEEAEKLKKKAVADGKIPPPPVYVPDQRLEEEEVSWLNELDPDYQYEQRKQERLAMEEQKAGLVAYYESIRQGGQEAASTKTNWWEKTVSWIDNHQAVVALGIGAVVGAAAIVISGGMATPMVVMGLAALAAGTVAVGGTIALNAHYDRPLSTNVVQNLLIAGGTAAAVVFIFGGSLTAGLLKLGNSVTGYCVSNPAACSNMEWALNTWDAGEQIYLQGKLAYQIYVGDSAGALETKTEIELETMDGGMPGNTTAKEIGSEALELVEKYGDDATELIVKYGDNAIALMQLYGDDAIDIIGAYGDDGIALLLKYGDDAIDLIQNHGTPAVKVLSEVDIESATELLETLDIDVLDYAIAEGPEALAALSRWSEKDLREYGPELALRAQKDAEVLRDIHKLVGSGPLDPKSLTQEQKVLIEAIAANSKQYGEAGQIVLGKWVDYGGGFAEVARETGSAHYNPHPDMWNLLGELGEDNREKVAWLINEQVIQTGVANRLPFEYTLNGIDPNKVEFEEAAIEAIWDGATEVEIKKALGTTYLPIRTMELMELKEAGYVYTFDATTNSYILILP